MSSQQWSRIPASGCPPPPAPNPGDLPVPNREFAGGRGPPDRRMVGVPDPQRAAARHPGDDAMDPSGNGFATQVEWFAGRYEALARNVESFIRGKPEVVRAALVCMFSEGHLLI